MWVCGASLKKIWESLESDICIFRCSSNRTLSGHNFATICPIDLLQNKTLAGSTWCPPPEMNVRITSLNQHALNWFWPFYHKVTILPVGKMWYISILFLQDSSVCDITNTCYRNSYVIFTMSCWRNTKKRKLSGKDHR